MSFLLRVKVSHRNTVLSAKVRTDLVISCERLLYVFFLLCAILTGLRWMGLSLKKGDVTNQDTATFQSKSDNRWIVCSVKQCCQRGDKALSNFISKMQLATNLVTYSDH